MHTSKARHRPGPYQQQGCFMCCMQPPSTCALGHLIRHACAGIIMANVNMGGRPYQYLFNQPCITGLGCSGGQPMQAHGASSHAALIPSVQAIPSTYICQAIKRSSSPWPHDMKCLGGKSNSSRGRKWCMQMHGGGSTEDMKATNCLCCPVYTPEHAGALVGALCAEKHGPIN